MIKSELYLSMLAFMFASLSNTAKAQVASVNLTYTKQFIDGFGASTAWHGPISETEADAAFNKTTSNQLGLTILRVRIETSSGAWSAGMTDGRDFGVRKVAGNVLPYVMAFSMRMMP